MSIFESLNIADPLANLRQKSGITKIFEYEFLNPNLWDFFFLDNIDLRYLVQSVSLPFIKLETETRNIGSKVLKSVTPEDGISITFYETSDFEVYQYMTDWMDEIFDKKKRKFQVPKYPTAPSPGIPSGVPYQTPPRGYVKTGVLNVYKYNKINIFTPPTKEVTKQWKFSNLMLTGIDQQDWDYEGVSGKQITCQFTVDSVDEM